MKGAVDATAEPLWTCSECGTTATSLRVLKRTRRRRRATMLALGLVFLAIQTDRIRILCTRHWTAALPNLAIAIWPVDLAPLAGPFDQLAGSSLAGPRTIQGRVQRQIEGRLRSGRLSRLDTWILLRRVRGVWRERGLIDLSAADLDAVDRAEHARIAMHNGEVSIDDVEAAASSIGLAFVDGREWKDRWWLKPEPRRDSYDGPLDWGDGHTWDVTRTSAPLATVLNNLAIEETWGVTADRLQLAPQRELDRRLHVYDTHDIIRRLVAADRANVWRRRDCRPRAEHHQWTIDLVTELCTFDLWTCNGGEAAELFAFGDRLVVDAPPRVHAEVREFLAMLESALMTKHQTPDESAADLTTLVELKAAVVTDGEPLPATIGDAARLIERRTGRRVDIRLEAGRGPEVLELAIDARTPLTASGLCDAIAASLLAAGVAAPTWTADGEAIAIGTLLPTVTRAYSLADIKARMRAMAGNEWMVWNESLQVLIDRVTEEIEFDQWVDNGGEIASIRQLEDLLVVRGTPTIHARVTRLLNEIAAEPPMPYTIPRSGLDEERSPFSS